MGSGSTKTKTNQTTTPQVPSWIMDPQQAYVGRVNSAMESGQGYTPATAQQQQAFGFKGSLLDSNPILNNTSKYMNQYEDSVIGNATRDLGTGRQQQIAQDQGRATAAGAFGGSRHGVVDSLTNDAYYRNLGDTVSNLRYQGYNNAQDAALQDANYGINAAASNRADAGTLASLGEQQRQLNALQNPNSPESLAIYGGLLGYNPQSYIGSNTTGTTTQSGGGLGQVLGGIGSLAMGLGTGGLGFGLSGLGGGLLSGAGRGLLSGGNSH